jgi:hypothetical protein
LFRRASYQEALILVSMSTPDRLTKILAPAAGSSRATLRSTFVSGSA